MKVYLMYPNRDFFVKEDNPWEGEDLFQDLGLDIICEKMSQGDELLFNVAKSVFLWREEEVQAIYYRQEVLKDCLRHPDMVKRLYDLTQRFMERRKKQWFWLSPRYASASSILSSARGMLRSCLDLLEDLREIAHSYIDVVESPGLIKFFHTIEEEITTEYLSLIEKHLHIMRFEDGVLLRARLGRYNRGINYVLCLPRTPTHKWLKKIFSPSSGYSFSLHPRDHNGARALGEIRDRGIASVAKAMAQAALHLESYFKTLQREVAFYLGAINLYKEIRGKNMPLTFPKVNPAGKNNLSAKGLYNLVLLIARGKVVDNSIDARDKNPVIITGPNQGGKTTFLQSIGIAQIMMQAGLFVGAKDFSSAIARGVFTHFKREEDRDMQRGKFEEELRRISRIIDSLRPGGMVLLNESFGATNEREGSQIAGEIVGALVGAGVRVFYVTHLYEFAHTFYKKHKNQSLFLRAERLKDGTRTFKLREAPPLYTSYGTDLYHRIFKQQ